MSYPLPIIGLDGGNKYIKTVSTFFHAGIQQLNAKPAIGMDDGLDLLRYNGSYYAVSSDRLSLERNKTLNQNHLLLSFIGIAKELRARGLSTQQDIILAVGLPPGYMESAELSKALRSYYLHNEGVHHFRCGDDIPYRIHIREVIVCPQAYSIFLTLPEEVIMQPNIHVVDIGGGTVDDVQLLDQKPVLKMLSLEKGVIHLYREIEARMRNQYGRAITEKQVDDIILERPTFFKQEHIDLVETLADAHVKRIFETVRENGVDWLSSYVVFSGGASVLFSKYIKRYADKWTGDYMIVDDICANAKGFEVFAETYLSA